MERNMKQEYHGFKGKNTQTYKKLYGYKNLIVWQAADELSVRVHTLTRRFGPGYYEHANQLLGSASSAQANIAEEYCRNALGDYIRFCEIARTSKNLRRYHLFSRTTHQKPAREEERRRLGSIFRCKRGKSNLSI